MKVAFEEVQSFARFTAGKLLLIFLPLAAAFVAGGGAGIGIGPVAAAFVGAGVVLLFKFARLTVTVGDTLHIVFRPFVDRTIRFDEIASAEAAACRPLRDYGGWGVRRGWKGIAYNVRGNTGVQLVLKNGKRILIGSQRPEELARALNERMGRLS